MERTRRNANRSDHAKSSLAGLLALQKSGKKRAEQFECAEEDDVYDVVCTPAIASSFGPTVRNCANLYGMRVC